MRPGRHTVGVKQQHQRRLQPLGAVHRQQLHRLGVGAGRRLDAAALEGAHQRIRRRIAPAIKLQRRRQQRLQIGNDARARRRRRGCRKPGQYVTIMEDGMQRVVWGQLRQPGLPARQRADQRRPVGGAMCGKPKQTKPADVAHCACRRDGQLRKHRWSSHAGTVGFRALRSPVDLIPWAARCADTLAAGRWRLTGLAPQQGQANQVIVSAAKQRRFERLGQGQIIAAGQQDVQQGHDVLHLGRITEQGFFRL